MIGEHFHLDPWLIMRQWTERQFLRTWRWVKEAFNRPGITEHYLMRVCTMLSAEPTQPSDYRMDFVDQVDAAKPQMTLEEANQAALCRWGVALGVMDQIVEKGTKK